MCKTCWTIVKHCYSAIALFVLISILTSCDKMAVSDLPTPTLDVSHNYIGTSDHLAVSFEHPWKMSQNNSMDVSAKGIDKPMILAVELIPHPKFSGGQVSQRPAVLDGMPVSDHWEDVTGYLILHRVGPGISEVKITYPASLFDPALYSGLDLVGWELKVVLTSQIDAYPIYGAMTIGEKYPVTIEDVQACQTWIESAQTQMRIGLPTDLYITVPNSTAGVFLYYPQDTIVDSVVLTDCSAFDFK